MDIAKPPSRNKPILYFGAVIGVILIILLFLKECGNNNFVVTDKKSSLITRAPIDPSDSVGGICERLMSSSGLFVDSMPPQSSPRTPIKIIYSGPPVIRYTQGGFQRIKLRYSTNEKGAKNIIISFKGVNKYYSIPGKIDTSSHKKNSMYCDLAMDSSIQSGIFEMNIALQDSGNNVSKSVDKFIVIGSKVVNTSRLLPSQWVMIKSTNVANVHGHYIQFDSLDRGGEWVDEKQQKTFADKYTTAMLGLAIEPNFDTRYVLKDDTVLEFGGRANTYHIIALTSKSLILKEVQGGDGRFGVFHRVKNEWKNSKDSTNHRTSNNTVKSSEKNKYSSKILEQLSTDSTNNDEEEMSKNDTTN